MARGAKKINVILRGFYVPDGKSAPVLHGLQQDTHERNAGKLFCYVVLRAWNVRGQAF
jgi:hypothetical protein